MPSWELKWQKIRKTPKVINGHKRGMNSKKDGEIEEEIFGYEATVYEYRDI